MATIQEVTTHKTLTLKVVRKSRPVAFNGHANSEHVTFIDGVDMETGLALEKPLTITEARAKMLGLNMLLVNEEFAVRDQYTRDAGDGHTETVETLSENMFAPGREALILALDVLVIPDGRVGQYGYRTKKAVTVDGRSYAAGDLVPYRMVNTMLIQKILGVLHEKDFRNLALELANANVEAAVKIKTATDVELAKAEEINVKRKFKLITGVDYDSSNVDHQKILLELLK